MFVGLGFSHGCEAREYYADCGALNCGLDWQGTTCRPFEAYPGVGCRVEFDVVTGAIANRELLSIHDGHIVFAHFGVVCSRWSILNRLCNAGNEIEGAPLG